MTEFHSKWKTLPVELLHQIFQCLPAEESYNFSLVCKSWLQPAQAVLYSDVEIGSMLQLKAFQNIVEHNTQLGNMTKKLKLEHVILHTTHDSDWAEAETFKSLTTLLTNCLPNLEVLNDIASKSFIPTLEALLNSKLKHLKRLNTPHFLKYEKTEIPNYVTCALLLKDRLENIFISDDIRYVDTRANSDRLFFNRLYNQLHQFEKLEKITLEKATSEENEVVEYILNICKSLREISFYFRSETGIASVNNNLNISIERISSFAARPKIKALTTRIFVTSDFKMLFYIMHTFTQLEELTLTTNGYALGQDIFTSLLHYMSSIDEISVTFDKVYAQTITEGVNNHWGSASKPKDEFVKFIYTDDKDLGVVCSSFELSKTKESEHTETIIKYPRFSSNEWEHKYFIEKNGVFIREMMFTFAITSESIAESTKVLSEDFLAHTFAYCPDLAYLYLYNCILKQFTPHSRVDYSKESSLYGFALDECIIYPGVLEQLSLLLKEIEYLTLNEITFRTFPNTIWPSIAIPEINMPFTNIDSVIFGESYIEDTLFLKVFATSDRTYHYYQYDTSETGHLEESSEEEFNLERDDNHIYICCQTVPFFHIKRSE